MRGDTRLLVTALAAVLLALPGAASAGAEDTAPTFTRDVAPIFQQKCQACHRAGYIAPMSLVTYAESRPWARSIKTRVQTRQMPPWHIDKSVGIQDFENDRSLTDIEIDTIVRWVDAGAPRGNPRGHAGARGVRRRRRLELRRPVRRAAGSDHPLDAVHRAGRGPGPLVEAGSADRTDRGPLDSGHRDSSVERRRPPRHAPRPRAPAAGGGRGPRRGVGRRPPDC